MLLEMVDKFPEQEITPIPVSSFPAIIDNVISLESASLMVGDCQCVFAHFLNNLSSACVYVCARKIFFFIMVFIMEKMPLKNEFVQYLLNKFFDDFWYRDETVSRQICYEIYPFDKFK